MIIFDLDETIANCEHRRRFVVRTKIWVHEADYFGEEFEGRYGYHLLDDNGNITSPDCQSFYEACDQDTPIEPVILIWADQISLGGMGLLEIWSGRCESVRKKTEEWLDENLLCFEPHQLKMRPIGDTTPDDVLKERWLDEAIAEGKEIDMVFDSDPASIAMWKRRGVFVFNCCQHDGEF